MAATTRRTKTTRGRKAASQKSKKLVDFKWEGDSYVLDLKGDRVYRNWMAVETNKGFSILGAYRSGQAVPA